MTSQECTAPDIVTLRSGKRARLARLPEFNRWNDCWLVAYEHDSYTFTLYWPQLTFYSDGRQHPLDVVHDDAK